MIERYCPTLSGGVLRQALRSTAGAFAVLLLLGFLGAMVFPGAAQRMLLRFTAQLGELGLYDELSPWETARVLFSNNVNASLLSLLYGLIPFAFLSALSLGSNALLLGAFGALYVRGGYGLGAYLLGILPHGIFELPALVLSCALGLLVCRAGTDRLRRVEGAPPFLTRLGDCLRVFLFAAVPLLLIAALVETFITPLLLGAVL